jgi:hypothetical protein
MYLKEDVTEPETEQKSDICVKAYMSFNRTVSL